ncbi:MAG: transcription antitermination factor NusB [Gammaproteobacteria bacterium]|nr:MAG: transcription antitermination factor NusB [Gammaproteobacteria bacterium]
MSKATAPRAPSPRARSRARRAAVQAVYQWQMTNATPEEVEAQFKENPEFAKADTDYFHALIHGLIAELESVDQALAPVLNRPVAQVDPVERAVLRLACFELMYREDIPWRVVINEAVDLAKVFGAEQGHRFVNGVLDRLAKTCRDTSPAPD